MTLAAIKHWLITRLAQLLEVAPGTLDIHTPFANYGLASFEAVSLAGELESWLGKSLPETLFYDYPTIDRLAHFLSETPLPTARMTTTAHSHTDDETQRLANPIAIIGMGCRLPGNIGTSEQFWQALSEGRCTVTEIPAERWDINAFYDPDPRTPGKMYTRHGSFLSDIDRFDASFFDLSAREATRMDPQQRLLLEVAWEALEQAGITLAALDNSATGVFIGMMNNQEYHVLQTRSGDGSHTDDPFLNLGSASSVAAGRLSYLFNLRGPALTVDTACSSSLVATHLACQSLRNAECNLAIVGGVHLNLLPENMVNFCKMGMLSADGMCHTFDASANGFVLGEGCGVVILKRLSDALADGNPVLAIIRGSAVNQDGRSNGLTAPNRQAQEEVMRQALASAKLVPQQIAYVETHGSATALGDPIEIDALMAVMSEGRSSDRPLLIGSVKTNLGHLAGAAGMAGLLKLILTLTHEKIPPHLHMQQLNPRIRWKDYPVEVVHQLRDWPENDSPRIAGVSSFGWSGTNAHVLLEEAPPAQSTDPRNEQVLLLSARTESALELATQRLLAYVRDHPDVSLADIAHTTQVGRTPFRLRRAVVCHDRATALVALETRPRQRVRSNSQGEAAPMLAFLFPGLGESFEDVFADLYREEETFRATIEQGCSLLAEKLGLDLLPLLLHATASNNPSQRSEQTGPDLRSMREQQHQSPITERLKPLQQTRYAQPALFLFEFALARLLQQWGVVPDLMLGYSLGEYVAATLAGVLSLEDALTLVTRRAEFIAQCPTGAMLAVALPVEQLTPYLHPPVELAAINAPSLCVFCGPVPDLERCKQELDRQGTVSQWVRTEHAFHSSMLAPVREELTTLVRGMELHRPRIPYISNLTGTWITNEQATNPSYWARHLCRTVRFAEGVTTLLEEPNVLILEVGPGQALRSYVQQHTHCTGSGSTQSLALLPSSYEAQTTRTSLLTALGNLWAAGLAINWEALQSGQNRQILPLPTYPFERESYWVTPRRPHTSPAMPVSAPQEEQAVAPVEQHGRPDHLETEYMAPENELERRIAAIWEEQLGVAQVGVLDNFFALGGHSLLGMSVIARLYDSFGVHLILDQLFKTPTIAQLALHIEGLLIEEIALLDE